MREIKGPIGQLLGVGPIESMRSEVERRVQKGARLPTHVEIPFMLDVKRALQLAAEEADRFGHSHIGREHLLLGLLHDERSLAGTILSDHGFHLDATRERLVDVLRGDPDAARDDEPPPPDVRMMFGDDEIPP
jgi:ATP-dependent Clp protease ATP-binding subunit ClpC